MKEQRLYEVSYRLREIILAEKSNKVVAINIVGMGDVTVQAANMTEASELAKKSYKGDYDLAVTGVYLIEPGE